MASTIQSGFAQLKVNLEITDLQASTVSTRQQNVRDAVAKDLTVVNSFLVGSYKRSTMIAPLKEADVDIFVVLTSEYYSKYRPAALLDRVRTVLLKTYTSTPKVSRNGQAVTITFSDFKVDVVPAFNRSGGGYLIPDSIGDKWIETDPSKHDEHLSASNKAHGGSLVPLVKMLKGWNRVISGAFEGFYLELMAVHILNNVRIDDFPSGVRFVLEKGVDQIRHQLTDPAGLGGNVDPLANIGTVDEAVSRFTTALGRAKKAEEFESKGNTAAAFDEWRKIFDDYFPAFE